MYPRHLGYRNIGGAESVSTEPKSLSQRAHDRRQPVWHQAVLPSVRRPATEATQSPGLNGSARPPPA